MHLLWALPLAAALAAPVTRVEGIPRLALPLNPASAAVAQLRLDAALLSGTPAFSGLTPSLGLLTRGAEAAAPGVLPGPAGAHAPAADAPIPAAPAPTASAPVEAPASAALERASLAHAALAGLEPGALERMPEAERDAMLSALWDGWKSRGLLDAGLTPADRLVIEGVDDPSLTSFNKSAFLGVGVLGYPLEDALWLQRTRINDALDENALSYPSGQRWTNESGTPEFLGRTRAAQGLVDAWGAAATAAGRIVRQARAGSRDLPDDLPVSREAAAGLAAVAAELVAAGDEQALRYLEADDPTFAAFLLDARKPGYYLYNGDSAVVSRILGTAAARALGIRRLDKPDTAGTHASTYLYRPWRVAQALREASRGDGDADARARLGAYAARLEPLVAPAPPAGTGRFRFVPPSRMPAPPLEAAANRLASYPGLAAGPRWDLPLTAGFLRERFPGGRPHGSFSAERWAALERLWDAAPTLRAQPDAAAVRVVGESWQTGGRLVAPGKAGGVVVHMHALDLIAGGADPAPFVAAVEQALRR